MAREFDNTWKLNPPPANAAAPGRLQYQPGSNTSVMRKLTSAGGGGLKGATFHMTRGANDQTKLTAV